MINITVPEYDLTVTHEQINTIPAKSGVYVIYGDERKPMYVGRTMNLSSRIRGHLGAEAINTRPFAHMFKSASMFYEDDLLFCDIYETYLINTMQPMINFNKTIVYKQPRNLTEFKKKIIVTGFGEFFRCKGLNNRGIRCQRSIFNSDYCHMHMDQKVDAG